MTDTYSSRRHETTATITPQVIRPGRASLRTTYQLTAEVDVSPSLSLDTAFHDAAQIVMDWLESKFPQALPKDARDLESFELDHHGQQQLAGVSIVEDGLWSVKLIQPDAPFRGQDAVAGRTWTTEIALNRTGTVIRFGVRILCASAPFATEPIKLTRPRVVLELANRFGLREIRPINSEPWILTGSSELDKLHDLLIAPNRTLPIILLTQPDKAQWHCGIGDYVLDQRTLARRLNGFAHIVCMPKALGYEWTELVGKVWSAYLGATRTYYPQVNPNEDSPFRHPIVLPDKILFWRYDDQEGEGAFASFLYEKMAQYAATKSIPWHGCMFFADARARRAELTSDRIRREAQQHTRAKSAEELRQRIAELQKAHTEEVGALRAKISESEKIAEEFNELATQYKNHADRCTRENRNLACQNDALRVAIEAKTGISPDANLPIPEDYADMPEWVDKQLAGRLVLHPRALQGIKRAVYEDVRLVYDSLLLLARDYRNMRLCVDDAKRLWEEGIERLELRFGNSITKQRAGEQGEQYFVRFPQDANQRRFLEHHLRKGSEKNDKSCLAVYFFWDEDTSQVVVGWLPSHLKTRAT